MFYICSTEDTVALQRFGSAHTAEKLRKLEDYLRAYSTALKHQGFHLIFFDAFAGTGDIQVADEEGALLDGVDDYSPFIQGSSQRALQLGVAFDEYIFVEKSRTKARELERIKQAYPTIADRISVRCADANDALLKFCSETNWTTCRAVVFLDPYGNQVKWTTIEAIARTPGIDLWYLFPAGLGVHRQIGSDATVHASHEASLDEMLGTTAWRTAFIEEQVSLDLFGPRKEFAKVATPRSVTLFMIRRMREVFRGGVLDEWLPLGSSGIHMYSLLFAWANPSEKAKLAGKLAAAVLRSKRGGRS
jgi:three-Cys-motif partner protein